MKTRNREIGSHWYFHTVDRLSYQTDANSAPGFLNLTLLSTCRSAINLILDCIGRQGVALVPSFTCHSVIHPFTSHGFTVVPYPVNKDLSIDQVQFELLLDRYEPSVILFHEYFGFNTIVDPGQIIVKTRAKGAIVIEDRTQSMFSSHSISGADYQTGSIRKWLPVPDGAFVSGFEGLNLSEDKCLAQSKLKALMAKTDYINNNLGEKKIFMQYFAEAEQLLDSRTEPFAISRVAKEYMKTVDFAAIKEIRRSNYQRLARELGKFNQISLIRPSLNNGDVPFILPVLVKEKRSEFQKYMAANNVYPTIIWRCPEQLCDTIDENARYIYDHILCFHIDQRYGSDDMTYIAKIAANYFESRFNNKC